MGLWRQLTTTSLNALYDNSTSESLLCSCFKNTRWQSHMFFFFIASVSVTIILIGPLEHYLHRIGDKPFSEPDSLTHISGTEGRWVERCLAYTNVISAKAVNKHDDVIKWKHFPRYWPFVRWIPPQRPVTQSFDVYFDLHPNKQLSKQSWGWWFETQSRPLWRHRNDTTCWLLAED